MMTDWLGAWKTWWWPGLAGLAAILATAWWIGHAELAVYALSFWHYAVYALAFLLRRVTVATFKTDAFLLKGAALLAFGWAYLDSGPGVMSAVLMALGFGLNIWAAQTLGADRTYYGFEIGGMEAKWITALPFSVIAHPMLIGNMIAFAAPLLDPEFRAHWWPLAVTHVGLNGLTIVMETRAGRVAATAAMPWFAGAAAGMTAAVVIGLAVPGVAGPVVSILMLLFAALLFRRYAREPIGDQGNVRGGITR